MRIVVNGDEKELAGGITVKGLLEALGLAAGSVAVERNRVIVKKGSYGSTVVEDGDRLEIVQFVGGG